MPTSPDTETPLPKTVTPARSKLVTSTLALLAVALGVTACGGEGSGEASADVTGGSTIPQPTDAMMAAASLDEIPVAPASERIDIAAPTFSNPTEITNPLFPISELRSVVFSGRIDGQPFHTETTLLPETQLIEWAPGQTVETRVSQYFAYIDGRIEEVALDNYAQADDGSVWYFGEDVHDYDTGGQIDSTEGTWVAGRDGPPAMIMPGDPQVGDVHRAENLPGLAFEEVSIKQVGKTVQGPAGPVEGAMVARELHDDGTYSDKIFAPGYGEFYSAHGRELEPLALAVPTDALGGPTPAALGDLKAAAQYLLAAAQRGDAKAARAAEDAARSSWKSYSQGRVPPRLQNDMERALRTMTAAEEAGGETALATAAIDVAQSTLDLELRYRDPSQVDVERFELWARQLAVDAASGELGAVRGDIATLEWIRDRFASTLDPAQVTSIDAHLVVLRDAVANGNADLRAAGIEAAELERPLELGPVPLRD